MSANNNIGLNAAGNTEIIGSNLSADADQNYSGDVKISAGEDVLIAESHESVNSATSNTEGTATLSVSVTNQVVEVAKAYENLEAADEQFKEIKEDYRQNLWP